MGTSNQENETFRRTPVEYISSTLSQFNYLQFDLSTNQSCLEEEKVERD